MLRSLQDEIPKLRDRHRRVLNVFVERGVPSIGDEAACIELLRDERLRADFLVKLKQFLVTLDLVLPRPEALPYIADAKSLANIQIRARNRYRGGERPIGKDVGEKVRRLIDDHIISLGVDPSVPPISILDADFDDRVDKENSTRAKASEMEHAVRWHIRRHLDEDPERYAKLSERLEEILAELQGRWDELTVALSDLIREVRAGRQADESGLDPDTQAPFLGLLKQEVAGDGDLARPRLEHLAEVTIDVVDHIQQEIRLVGFWQNAHAQEVLHRWLVQFLDDQNLLPFDRLSHAADRVVELAKANHAKLSR